MTRRTFISVQIAILSVTTLAAHHPLDEFDLTRTVEITGVVTRVEWANPHVVITIDSKNAAGAVTQWRAELQEIPSGLLRRGWTTTSVKVGDTVVAKGFPARTPQAGVTSKVVVTGVRLSDGAMLDSSSDMVWGR